MGATLQQLVAEALATGTIQGLPDRHVIDGRSVPSASGARMETMDPGTGKAFAAVAAGGAEDGDHAVDAVRAALSGDWRRTTPVLRSYCRIKSVAARIAPPVAR